MESGGKKERVHVSEQTALQLIKHGKEDWIVRREDVVEAKGKGKMVTFWLKLTGITRGAGSIANCSDRGNDETVSLVNQSNIVQCSGWNVEMPASKTNDPDNRNDRLAEWNSEILLEILQRLVAHRAALQPSRNLSAEELTDMALTIGAGSTVVDEVAEIIEMPDFVCMSSAEVVELSDAVVTQLRDFVAKIALMYNDNPCKCPGANTSSEHCPWAHHCFVSTSVSVSVHNFEHVRKKWR
jgi:Adenylate and Guanylate cyclase catalytic domain